MRALFEIFDVTIIIENPIVVNKCVLRGRPQGGRAVFWIVLEKTIPMVMTVVVVVSSTLSLFRKVRKFDVGFDRAARFLTPSRVEMIVKRSILCLETTTNR